MVSNPPYVPSADLAGLDREVADWEDPAALDGGPDGLDVAREVLARAPAVLRGPHRAVWLELDASGPALLRRSGYPDCACFDDLSGRPRFVRVTC